MVREGTEFLSKGVRQNRNAPRLVWYTGWFYGNKMGMSDEKTQFRKLFSEDEVLHESLMQQGIAVDSPEARGPYFKPDNWLVGRLWLMHGYDIVDSGVKIRRQTPLNFFETGPKWRIKHAESIEEEGVLDDRAQNAWQLASEGWRRFGERSVPTTSPFTIKLGQLDELVRLKALRIEEFKKTVGDAASGVNEHADFMELAKRADPKVRLQAIELAGEIADLEQRRNKTDGYRKQINYPYWDTLSLAEQEERTVTARRLIYEAEKANEAAELDKAIDLYEQAFAIWAEIFDDYPILTIDDSAEDLMQSVRRYSIAIDSEELPEDFPLNAFVEMMAGGREVSSEVYEDIRVTQKEKAEQRKKELEAEERERERKAAEEMKAAEEKEKAAKETKESEAESKAEEDESQQPTEEMKEEEAAAEEEPTEEEPAEDKPAEEEPAEEEPAEVEEVPATEEVDAEAEPESADESSSS
ncbi:IRE (iron responsive element)-like protein [Rhodopirellula maiorica SM1]|uniref:IRE (Iron responsive element)-like protein n=2 Tax=Novipirellula TaxID=2795426 RepID=M5RLA6_9BACT|nr:IRE (iron responsive element)-like protein [Rhodopirellula maiorica SM1]